MSLGQLSLWLIFSLCLKTLCRMLFFILGFLSRSLSASLSHFLSPLCLHHCLWTACITTMTSHGGASYDFVLIACCLTFWATHFQRDGHGIYATRGWLCCCFGEWRPTWGRYVQLAFHWHEPSLQHQSSATTIHLCIAGWQKQPQKWRSEGKTSVSEKCTNNPQTHECQR